MRTIKVAVLAISLFLLTSGSTVGAVSVGQPPNIPTKPESSLLITGYAFSGPQLQYVQLFNNSDSVFDLAGTTIEYTIFGQTDPIRIAQFDGLIKPGG